MKKVIFSWLYILGFLLFEIAVFILFFPFNTDNDNYIASMIFWLVLTIIVSILSNNFYFAQY